MGKQGGDKDIWDRITALSAILVPAAIALAGHYIGSQIKDAEAARDQQRAADIRAFNEANIKLAQATFLNTIMKSLTSKSPNERKLAVEAVLIALPEQGPTLVRAIAAGDESKEVQAVAVRSLEERYMPLIRDLFAGTRPVRERAAAELVATWRNDSSVVGALVMFAKLNGSNSDGIYNTMVVLSEFNLRALQMHKPQIEELRAVAESVGPKTAAKAAEVAKRLEY